MLCAIVLLLLGGVTSCDVEVEDSSAYAVWLKLPEVDHKAGGQFVYVDVAGDWTISLEFEDGTDAWAELDGESGSGYRTDIYLKYTANYSLESRTLSVNVNNGKEVYSCRLVQGAAAPSQGDDIKSDPVAGWLELPAMSGEDGLYYLTHYQQIDGSTIRSWSCLYDTDALLSHWVAYPINAWTIGTGSRTDEWGLDPKVPRDLQPVLFRGFRGGYDRGHQLPSADLYRYEANVTTFYSTNMTPQLGSLNQHAWANLEDGVRDWARSFDTLYVVTGCTLGGSTKVAYDNDGKQVVVPTGYYKALLGYKKSGTLGMTGTTGGYTSIAFWFDHEGYSGDYMNKAMTVDALEDKVGEDFFVNLPEKIGEEMAAKVESSDDSWWYK